jgi:DNA helicase-2/ATP-dependent DNA helicase PcrA
MTLAGITEGNIALINKAAKKKAYNDPTDIDYVFSTLKGASALSVTQKHSLTEIQILINKLIEISNKSTLSDFVYNVIMHISGLYKQSLVNNNPEDRRNRVILKELHKISSEFESLNPHGSLSDFISHLTLLGEFDLELDEGNETENAVHVTTIHQSKGKEFPVVFVVDVATNKLPLRYQAKKFFVPRELSKGMKVTDDEKELYKQEERRLLYVAMTRAEKYLFVTYARQYADNKRESKPSAFLNEMNFDNNPIIELIDFSIGESEIQDSQMAQDRLEHLRSALQTKAIRAICQNNLRTALEHMIQLAKIDYFQENGSFVGFNPDELTKITSLDNSLDNELKNIRTPLINKDNLKLSVSKLDTYKDCPLKFKFAHVLEIPTPSKTFFDLGTSVHAVVEHLTQLEKDGIEITDEIALDILDKEWIISSFKTETEAREAKDKAKSMISTYLKWRSTNPNSAVAAEQKFTIDIGKVPFNGSIDRVESTPDGDYELIDFKTGGVYETKNSIKENFQMSVYALAAKKLYGKLPTKASLFYLKKDKFITNNIELQQLDKVQKVLEEKVNSILAEDFHSTPSFDVCRKCDYLNICDDRRA